MALQRKTVYILIAVAVAAALFVVCAAAGVIVLARSLDYPKDGASSVDRTELVVRATGPDGQQASSADLEATVGTLMPQLLGSGHLRFRELLAELPARAVSTTRSEGPSAPTGQGPSRSHVLAKFPAEADKLVRTVPAETFQAGTPPMFDAAARLTPDEVSVLPVEWQYKVPQIDCPALSARPTAATEPPEEQIVACEDGNKLHLGPATLLGTDVKEATTDNTANGWGVAVEMTPDGTTKLAAVTRALTNRRLAIVHDGQVVSSPRIMEPLTGGNLEITGNFTLVEAVSLAAQLQSGALGITLQVERTKITRVPTR